MTVRPVLFSGPMILALLAGTKTQTRRLITSPLAKAKAGDMLWVRETWAHDAPDIETARGAHEDALRGGGSSYGPYYRVGETALGEPETLKWRPGIYMPRWASRLTLKVTEVRLQNLLDISNQDAEAEGFKAGKLDDAMPETPIGGGWTVSSPGTYASAGGMFQLYWQELHPDWDGYSSPEIVALTFSVHKANIDDVLRRREAA